MSAGPETLATRLCACRIDGVAVFGAYPLDGAQAALSQAQALAKGLSVAFHDCEGSDGNFNNLRPSYHAYMLEGIATLINLSIVMRAEEDAA